MLYDSVHISFYIRLPLKTNPFTGLNRPRVFQEYEDPRFKDNRYMKVVSLSALCTDRLYPQRNIPGTHFCWGWGGPRWHSG